MLNNDVLKILASKEDIENIVSDLASKISDDYKDKNLLMLCILKGAVVFMGDLMKHLSIPTQIDFMKVSSYGSSTESSGTVNIVLDLHRKDLSDLDILIVEDIIDSGKTLSYLVDYLLLKGAKSVKTCTMLDKPSRRVVDFVPNYCGMTVPDEFVIGYGLDYDENYRALPFIGVLKPEVYS
ncbi:MAG: hypoxanthine phosphoribosyltransferase [Ruminococcaceae bacterium]|nr:hypoxanthine phosphoribosyltransferase [Oscillospiraceae bacterium]